MAESVDGVGRIVLASPFLPGIPPNAGLASIPPRPAYVEAPAPVYVQQPLPRPNYDGYILMAVLAGMVGYALYGYRRALQKLPQKVFRLVSGGFELRVLEDGSVGTGPNPDETPFVTVRAGACLGTSVVMISQIMPVSGPDWMLTWAAACFFFSIPLLALVVYIQRFSGMLAIRWESRGYWWAGEVSFFCGLALVAFHVSTIALVAFLVAAGLALYVSYNLSEFIGEMLASVVIETDEQEGGPPVTRTKVWDPNAPDPDPKE